MQPIRQVFQEAPDAIPVPAELRHQPIEIIIWPLFADQPAATVPPPAYLRADVDQIVIPSREIGRAHV